MNFPMGIETHAIAFVIILELLICNLVDHFFRDKKDAKTHRISMSMSWILILGMASSICCILESYYYGNKDANFLINIVLALSGLPNFISLYFCYYIKESVKDSSVVPKWCEILLVCLCIVQSVLYFSTFFTPVFYSVKDGVFIPGPIQFVEYAFSLVSSYVVLLIVFYCKSQMDAADFTVVIVYVLLPIAANILTFFGSFAETKIHGVSLFIEGLLRIVLVNAIYVGYHMKRGKELEIKEKDLIAARIQLMQSQMQPHFLYNALTVISQLCKRKPELAYEATINFSSYLRGNLKEMKDVSLCKFRDEMEHVKSYLFLEKLRFGEFLNVEYDIKCEDFFLPPLTIQPMVENSVLHGLSDKPDGGTVKISTYEDESNYIVEVEDDGLGFEKEHLSGNGAHIAIKNVRERLKQICGGELTIESEIGKGTKVFIKIPKLATME